MKLYLIQHGLALAKEEDPERPLSTQGKAQTQRTAEYLKSRSIKVDTIWHSTKLRAVQTAEIIAEVLPCGKIQARDDMNPLDTVEKLPEEILASNKDIMIIGHLPFLQKLADRLLTGSEESKIIAFKNSGVVSLDYGEECQIDWLVSPEHM
ncbi:MAG: phosphohistidine phosphatase SixA [Candidatus Aminicenantes bacterium]|nr:phosphohistidine phosphatase SixA [Candidatus Aminicenantes bacterium]MDH5385620.1 phosphohistidine phosphatase SixA [Candidatus Aminicenantes bacterium]MDH5743666.1 phosphohistidine phosphatase SixA [Candidatus Aminicenantes bacterium]